MLLSIAINYVCGRMAGPEHRPQVRKAGAVLSVVLGWFKYAGFFGQMLHAMLPIIPVPQVVLPIGISFFTFQGLSYVIDVYRGDAAVQTNVLKVALYISFFPQLVAGPIVRYTTVAEEIDDRQESVSEFSTGATRFLFGLGKKMLLANVMAQIADAAFAASTPDAAFAWLGALLTRTWPSVWGGCSAFIFWKTSTIPTLPALSRISGGGGTFPCPVGSGIMFTFPWAAIAAPKPKTSATCSLSGV